VPDPDRPHDDHRSSHAPKAPAVTRVQVIARDNGAGLSRDLAILARALTAARFEVTVSAIGAGGLRRQATLLKRRAQTSWRRWRNGAAAGRFDVNLMDERGRPDYLPLARRNVLMPHPEWFDEADRPRLGAFDRIYTKTRHAVPIFEALGGRAEFVGFTSFDRRLIEVQRESTFFHLGGRSINKGSQPLLDLWLRKPQWPTLTLVQRAKLQRPAHLPGNLRLIDDYLDDGELQHLQNRHLFHLCPSETEGFGHHLVEGMSVGAIVLTTDAPPMNEMVAPACGVLAAYSRTGVQRLAKTYFIDPFALEAGVERMLALGVEERRTRSEAARAWWEANDHAFRQRLADAVAALADT
jgi:hypothetical protein